MPSIGAAKQALLLTAAAQIMHTAAFSSTIVARPTPSLPTLSLRPRPSQKVVLHAADAAADAAGDDAVDEAPAPTGLRAKLKKAASFKKGDLAKYGVSAFFAYGFVSNVNSCLLLSFTWATSSA